MIRVSSEELKPGMIVARSILDGGSSVKLAAGFVLDEAVIKRCRSTGMRHLWVHLEGEDVLPDCNVNDQLALQAQQAWKDNMDMLGKISDVQDSALENLSKFTADTSRFKDIVASSQVKSVVDRIISSILGQEPLILNLASLRTKEGYLYQHALDVAITSVMLAHKLKFSTPDIQEVALGCFLMDMGIIIVPKQVLEKTGDLTPREAQLMREHPAVGFAILRANEGLSINSAHVAYQHHENLDGSGYPRQIKGSNEFPQKTLTDGGGEIHRFALVAAVSDAYNTAVSPRPGVAPLSPLDAIKHLIHSAGNRFNSHVVNALISLIPVFPAGTRVTVTKAPKPMLVGYSGVVSKANPSETEKPQVLLLFDRYRRKTKPMLVDMAEDKGFEIQFQHL